jgi:hypothetical protein
MAEKVVRERQVLADSRLYARVSRITKLYLADPGKTAAAGLPRHAILPVDSFSDGADGYRFA